MARKLSEQIKLKISISLKGKHASSKTEFKKGHKGFTAFKDKKFSQEHKKKLSEAHKGKVLSKEHKHRISQGGKGTKRPPVTKEWRRKQSEAHRREKSPRWKGGINIASLRFKNWKWRALVAKIRKRDNWTCLYCHKQPACQVHHMLPVRLGGSDTEELLVTLCKKCYTFIECKIID